MLGSNATPGTLETTEATANGAGDGAVWLEGRPAAMTTFTKLTIYVSSADANACADLLQACEEPVALAVTSFEDRPSAGWLVEAYFDGSTQARQLDGVLAAIAALTRNPVRSAFCDVPDEDWTAKVQRDLAPVRAGRFIVHGRHDRLRVRPAMWAIEIEAGEAFGTAHHATTSGCLDAISRLASCGEVATIADIGCGTGVLAIAAAKAWPRARLMASDNDPVATTIAAANARLNGVSGRIRTVTAVGLSHPALRAAAPYDLILANILAAPLVDLAPAFTRALAPRGVLVLSGLLTVQAREVLGAYQARGLRRADTLVRGEWSTLVLRRQPLAQCPVPR